MTNCNITLTNEQNKYSVNEERLEEISCKMLNYIANNSRIVDLSELRSYELDNYTLNVDILICDDAQIKELNLNYRGKESATDVLSFALFADNPDTRIIINNEISLGEIIISTETANKQAIENNKTLEDEIIFLLSHGLLHLFGFDHPTEESLEFILKIQDEIISNI